MNTDLDGKIALVTGSARGIGHAIATTLARRGARVIAAQRNRDDPALIDAITAAGGRATLVGADLAAPDGVAMLVAATTEALAGRPLDILVNNAGVIDYGGLADTTPEGFDRQFAVNVRAPLFLTQALAPQLSDGGRIVFISSVVARTAFPGLVAYAMTKGAIDVAVRHLAAEFGPRGITVNAVAPGATATDMAAWLDTEEGEAQALGMQALQRIAQPSDIAEVVGFLASPAGGWVTGQVIDASGGLKL